MNDKDTSWKEDLNVGIQNLISIEEHSQQSYFSSKNEFWLELSNEIRKIRTRWMQISLDEAKGSSKTFFDDAGIILGFYYVLSNKKDTERNQKWCCCKHLLSSSMRGCEVGTKFLELEENNESKGIIRSLLDKFKNIENI